MEEKERQLLDETEELAQNEEKNEVLADTHAREELTAPEESEPAEEEDTGKRLYFGRFTPGVWHGGVIGIALSYIAFGLLGMMNAKLSLGIESALESPLLKYGTIAVLCYGLGKLGGILEKRREAGE